MVKAKTGFVVTAMMEPFYSMDFAYVVQMEKFMIVHQTAVNADLERSLQQTAV